MAWRVSYLMNNNDKCERACVCLNVYDAVRITRSWQIVSLLQTAVSRLTAPDPQSYAWCITTCQSVSVPTVRSNRVFPCAACWVIRWWRSTTCASWSLRHAFRLATTRCSMVASVLVSGIFCKRTLWIIWWYPLNRSILLHCRQDNWGIDFQ